MNVLTTPAGPHAAAIHQLWDTLAESKASKAQASLLMLMQTICAGIDSQSAWWLPAVRLPDSDGSDPGLGWRAPTIRYLNPQPADESRYAANARDMDAGLIPESTLNHVRQAGDFRSVRLRDHVSPAFFETAHYQTNYTARNITDALYVITPLNQDSESYLCFMRTGQRGPFTEEDLALAAYALRPLRWFQRQLFLSLGLLVGHKPLTPSEQRVLHELLTDKSEKQIAAALGLAPSTTHKYVTSIFRKFGVSGRAGLTALWLNNLS